MKSTSTNPYLLNSNNSSHGINWWITRVKLRIILFILFYLSMISAKQIFLHRSEIVTDFLCLFTLNEFIAYYPQLWFTYYRIVFCLHILTIKTRLLCMCIYIYIYIYIYICNELIEETAGHRKLIFGMWEYFGYGSSKF